MKYLLILCSFPLYAGGACSKGSETAIRPITPERQLVQQTPIVQPQHRLARSVHTRLDSTDNQEQNRVVTIHIRPEPVERIENKNNDRRPSRSSSRERRQEQYLVSRDITPPGAYRVLERNAELAVKRIKSEGQWTFPVN